MKSMTGFGRDEVETDIGKIVVEARAENHRFLDINLQAPDAISAVEPKLTEIVKKFITRGKVRVTVAAEGLRNKTLTINLGLAKEYVKTLEKLRKELKIEEEIEIEHVLMLKEFFSSEERASLNKAHIAKVEGALARAMKKLDEMRESEGKKLEKDLKQRAAKIEKIVQKIEKKRDKFTKTFAENLRERVKQLLEDVQVDEARLFQEVAFLAERSDITEEIVRLRAHISKLKEVLGSDEAIGRTLDFLLQEMNREVSTTAAKSKDAEISHFTVELRAEMERIREQIQNIE